jgi:hypothetical protein
VRTWHEKMADIILEPYLTTVVNISLEIMRKLLTVLENQITKEKI